METTRQRCPTLYGGSIYLFNLHISPRGVRGQHNPTTVGTYAIQWRSAMLFRAVDITPERRTNYYPGTVLEKYYEVSTDEGNPIHPRMSAYDVLPLKWSLVQASGEASGRYYNFWMHGELYMEPQVRLVEIVGTRRPLSIYHFHCQQQLGDYFLELRDAEQVSVYGSKSELTYGVANIDSSRHIRYLGHSGIGAPSPDNPAGIDWFFRFADSDDFVFGGFAPDLEKRAQGWVCHHFSYGCWWRGAYGEDHPLIDVQGDQTTLVDKLHSPVIYQRGEPQMREVR